MTASALSRMGARVSLALWMRDDADRSLSPELGNILIGRFGRRRNLVPVILLLLVAAAVAGTGVEISVFL